MRSDSSGLSVPGLLRLGDDRNSWESTRRPEIERLLEREMYGVAPEAPVEVTTESEARARGSPASKALERSVRISFVTPGGAFTFPLSLYLPRAAREAVPAFLLFSPFGADSIEGYVSIEAVVGRGYALAILKVGDIEADADDGYCGMMRLYDGDSGERRPDAWGKIAAWAFAGSRAMDFLAREPTIRGDRVAVIGHSRFGKTALWCGARDPRFFMTVSCQSGCGGAALSRGKEGETVERINRVFPYWFSDSYKLYGGREAEAPFDQHMALSLVAPRLLYVSSAVEDAWADPRSEFRSCVLASPVYGLYGLQGVETEAMPDPDRPLRGGSIAYHLRSGGHSLDPYDWDRYMDFFDERSRGEGA